LRIRLGLRAHQSTFFELTVESVDQLAITCERGLRTAPSLEHARHGGSGERDDHREHAHGECPQPENLSPPKDLFFSVTTGA
jgi:hypothetical protein